MLNQGSINGRWTATATGRFGATGTQEQGRFCRFGATETTEQGRFRHFGITETTKQGRFSVSAPPKRQNKVDSAVSAPPKRQNKADSPFRRHRNDRTRSILRFGATETTSEGFFDKRSE